MGLLQLLGAPDADKLFGPTKDDVTQVTYYNPETGETKVTSKTVFNDVNRTIDEQDKWIQEYIDGSPEFKKKFDEENPDAWTGTGGRRPGDEGFHKAEKSIFLSEVVPPGKPKWPKGAPPTKIDITTGKGAPGGFDGGSVKLPDVESKRLASNIAAIISMASKISGVIAAIKAGKIPPIPEVMDALNKVNDLKKKMLNKLKISVKVPNFSKVVVIPAAPPLPAIPDFKSMGIPDLPSIPSVPSIPSSIPGSIPNSIPNVSNIV